MSGLGRNGIIPEDMPPNTIAIIGMGCKYPGANSVEEFWHILDTGQSMLSEPPKGRFPTHDHQRNMEKGVYLGNFLDDVASFDHRFFKKSAREAASMDPQQRLLLEVSYQALESSGFFGPRKPDLDVGCFVGVCASDYNDNVASHPPNAFSALGTLRAFVPGRISHFFGFTGPSVAIDTACSSSAVAIDAACKAIMHGDCKSAIAGGVSVFTSPFFYQNLSAASFLSSTGASKSFDASADGYCRGEGVGIVVLKQLSQAVADGDIVMGTILATSVRQSSNKVPITVPYSPSQTALYRKLLNTASMAAEEVTYVEAHGTGTPVGDPLEYEAIKEVFGSQSRREPLHFASVKGNIGHTEGASGVAGLIKIILMMQNRAIPRQASYVSVHPKITLVSGQLSIPTETLPWTADTLVACANNYGAAGSIAAMMIKEAPSKRAHGLVQGQAQNLQTTGAQALNRYPLILTANSSKSLGDNCARLRDYVSSFQQGPASSVNILADLTFNLSDKQNWTLPSMFATTVFSLSDLDNQLRAVASHPDSSLCQTNPKRNPIILIFGGQTARFVGLSKDVYDTSALLRKYLDECNEIIKSFGCRSIYPGIFETKPTDDVVSLQTMQFAMHYACARSWIACGLKVDCVLGHSFGQLVALTVAGILSLVHGLKLVHGRAVLMRDKWGPERGSMIALEADHRDAVSFISSVQKVSVSSDFGLEVACFNGPKSHVLVGSSAEIDSALVEVAKKTPTAKVKVLDVTHGFHSRFCDPILSDLEELAQCLTFNKPKIYIETCSVGNTWPVVTAKLIADHTRTPVYFEDAVKRIEARYGVCTWLEAGSNTSVTSMARHALTQGKNNSNTSTSTDHLFCPVNLCRDDALNTLASTTVNLWKHGHHVQFWPFHHIHNQDYRALNLPPYQFEKTRHWVTFNLQAEKISDPASALLKTPDRPLIEPEPESEPEPELITFSGFEDTGRGACVGQKQAIFRIDPRSEEWRVLVDGHTVLDKPLCPVSLYVELVLQAAKQLAAIQKMPCAPFACVDDLEITSPLGISQKNPVQLVLMPIDQMGRRFNFSFLTQSHMTSGKHAIGKVEIIPADDTTVIAELERTKKLLQYMHHNQSQDREQNFARMVTQPGGEAVHGTLIYKVFSTVVQYRDFYRGVRRVSSSSNGTVMAEVYLPESQPSCIQGLLSMPVAIDNFFQVPGFYANCLAPCPSTEVFVSTHVDRIQFAPEFGKLQVGVKNRGWDVFAISTTIGDKESSNDIFVTDQVTGQLVFVAFGAKFNRVLTTSLAKMLSRANMDVTFAAESSTFPQGGRVNKILDLSVASRGKPQVIPSSHSHPRHQQQQPHQPHQPHQPQIPNMTAPVDQALPSLPSLDGTGPQKLSVENELREMLSKMTDIHVDQFQGYVTFSELGIDSLMMTEIVSEIHEVFHILVPQNHLQDLQTYASLCRYVDHHESRQGSREDLDLPLPQAALVAPPLPVSLPDILPNHPIISQDINFRHKTNQFASMVESSKIQEDEQHRDLVLRLASLLASHLDCPVSDFERSTNLTDRGLDSLLCIELVSDLEKIFGVSVDLSVLSADGNFGDLADILVSAVSSLGQTSMTDSSINASTLVRSSGLITPLTFSDEDVGEAHVLTRTTAAFSSSAVSSSSSVSTIDVLANAAQEFESIKDNFDRLADEYKFSDFYAKVYDKQACLVLAYVVEAFSDLGVDLNSLRSGDPIPKINVISKHGRMLDVLHEILRHGKLADYDGRQYIRSDVPVETTHSSVLFKNLVTQFPQHAKEHTLLSLCGADMSNFLSGKMDPLSVLFGNKMNRNIIEDVYTTAPMFAITSELLTSFLEKALSKSAPGLHGKFHIVELGAGTGATTRWVVERLLQRGIPIEYTFTDISSALVSAAKRKFAKFDCVKFATIDIEKEPAAHYQGQFDIVLATNCIHATSNLPNSLKNINKLLRPHGFVSLVELTTRNFWLDVVFGLLDGWWLFDDGRPYVLATPEFWDKSMRQIGFQHVSWTGGYTRESEVVRVITGFKQPVEDPSRYHSIPQEKTRGVETIVFAHTDKRLPLRADVHYPSSSHTSTFETWVAGTEKV